MNYLILAGDQGRIHGIQLNDMAPFTRVVRILKRVQYEELGALVDGSKTIFIVGTGDYSGKVFQSFPREKKEQFLRHFGRVDIMNGNYSLKRVKENGKLKG